MRVSDTPPEISVFARPRHRFTASRISDVDQEIVTYRSGIEFVEPSDRVREVIVEFLDAIKASRSGA